MGPAHDPHVLWMQLGLSSFFLQRWPRALDVFARIVSGVTQASKKKKKTVEKICIIWWCRFAGARDQCPI